MKTAVIGIGVIGRVHLSVLAEMGAEVVALCDTNVEKAAVTGRENGFDVPIYTDYRRMLTEVRPDAVHICTPHYLHAEMVIEALSRDINVLCEKPLCIKKEDIPRILAAEAASKAALGVCHQNRYNPANRFVKEYLKDRRVRAAHGSVVWHRDAAYYAQAAWRGKWETEGGGVMINQALHTLDLLTWLLGEPETVSAGTLNLSLDGVIEVEDTVAATFRGATAPYTFFATNSNSASLPVEIALRLENGEDITLLPHTVLRNGEVIFSEKGTVVRGKVCYGPGHGTLLREFYRCIAEGEHFPIDGHEGARIIRMILAIYESKEKEIRI